MQGGQLYPSTHIANTHLPWPIYLGTRTHNSAFALGLDMDQISRVFTKLHGEEDQCAKSKGDRVPFCWSGPRSGHFVCMSDTVCMDADRVVWADSDQREEFRLTAQRFLALGWCRGRLNGLWLLAFRSKWSPRRRVVTDLNNERRLCAAESGVMKGDWSGNVPYDPLSQSCGCS